MNTNFKNTIGLKFLLKVNVLNRDKGESRRITVNLIIILLYRPQLVSVVAIGKKISVLGCIGKAINMSGLKCRAILKGLFGCLICEVPVNVTNIFFIFDVGHEGRRDFSLNQIIPIDAGKEGMGFDLL